MKIRNRRRHSIALILAGAAAPASAQSVPEPSWVTQFGTSANDYALAIAPDGDGGVLSSGYTLGSLGGPSAGAADVFIARHDSGGSQIWRRQFGTSLADFATSAATDEMGGAYIAGRTHGALGGPSAGFTDAFVARYDAGGAELWIRQLGTSADDGAYGLAPDGAGGVFVTGYTWGSLAAGNVGRGDAWLARYDSGGNQVWVRQFGTTRDDVGRTVAPDGAGGVFVAGKTERFIFPNIFTYDAFLARYDGDGNQIWSRQFGTDNYDGIYSLAPDGAGGVLIAGETRGSIAGPHAGDWDAFIARYDSAGNRLWIRQFGSAESDYATSIIADSAGGAFVTGITAGSLAGAGEGLDDAFVARYSGNGERLWIRQLGTSAWDQAWAAAPDGTGGAVIAGWTGGVLGVSSAGGYDAFLARFPSDAQCYANCDGSTAEPILNVDDFTCFIDEFAQAQSLPHEQQLIHYANCDQSTAAPVLNVDDFTCFIDAFAAGCR